MRAVFSYLVPVMVEVEDGEVKTVRVIDETPIKDPRFQEGDKSYFPACVDHAEDGDWPCWRFGW